MELTDRIKEFNSRLDAGKKKAERLKMELELNEKNISALTEQLSKDLGTTVTAENAEQLYLAYSSELERQLANGNEILDRIERGEKVGEVEGGVVNVQTSSQETGGAGWVQNGLSGVSAGAGEIGQTAYGNVQGASGPVGGNTQQVYGNPGFAPGASGQMAAGGVGNGANAPVGGGFQGVAGGSMGGAGGIGNGVVGGAGAGGAGGVQSEPINIGFSLDGTGAAPSQPVNNPAGTQSSVFSI